MFAKEKIQGSLKVLASLITVISIFCAVVEVMLFLSYPKSKAQKKIPDWTSFTWSLFVNQILISIFILHHSLGALPEVKNWLAAKLKLEVLQRSFYILFTAFTLQLLVKYWHEIPEISLWHIDTSMRLYWWMFITLHGFAWVVIYVGSICMDVNELLGIKQVYYSLRNISDPNSFKSYNLKRLYSHMRHPSFIGFLIIFWIVPCMSLDRFFLAAISSIYMYLMWNTDKNDYYYHQTQFERKFQEFQHVS